MTYVTGDSWHGGPVAELASVSIVKAAAVSMVSAAFIGVAWILIANLNVPGSARAPVQPVLDPTFPFGSRPARLLQSLPLTSDLNAGSPSAAPGDDTLFQSRLLQARIQLAQALQAQMEQAASSVAALEAQSDPAPSPTIKVPIPRARPPESQLAALAAAAQDQAGNGSGSAPPVIRELLQKFASLFPEPFTLASAAPDGGVSGSGQDLPPGLPGYDRRTAVYDISARLVYMPNGTKLEAHSGFGSLLDDPSHINVHNLGATPPHAYDLTLREKPFHGVQALRMVPIGGGDLFGRSGLLAHSYMLGPNGDSNGCVSIRDYDAFLKAFMNGEIKHLLVVTSVTRYASANAGKA